MASCHLQHLAPGARIIMTADDEAQAEKLREAGAHDAVTPSSLAGGYLLRAVILTPTRA